MVPKQILKNKRDQIDKFTNTQIPIQIAKHACTIRRELLQEREKCKCPQK